MGAVINSYKNRTLRQLAQRQARGRQETRDAIVWDVNTVDKICKVKIQGSNQTIECKYPENWKKVPEWLKVGNAVTMRHTGGNKNRFELVGHGITVPTQWTHAESGDTWEPDISAGDDCVISGCRVLQLPVAAMQVMVETGVYRLNDIQYTLGEITMSDTSEMAMSGEVPMDGTVAAVVAIDAAHATEFRIDAIVIGTDGVVDVVKGVTSANDPQIPATPAGHFMLKWVFVAPGTTAITQSMIGRTYVAPIASQLSVTYTGDIGLLWTESSKDLVVEVLDQYGINYPGPWRITAEITSGTGGLITPSGDIKEQTQYILSGAESVTFTYYRPLGYDYETDPAEEECPVYIEFTLVEDSSIKMHVPLLVLNESGVAII